MANVNKNFVGSRMNKSLDERLVPAGEYFDALNIRISSDEDGEAGSAENSKGNEKLVTLKYEGSVLTNPECIGVYEDGESESIYWFVTSDDADMIVSYNTRTEALIYHVISETVLNFNSQYRMHGIDLIDDFLFFTDNYNQPRRINVKRNYPHPISGADQIDEDDIAVIVKPPVNAPVINLLKKANKQNYMEDKFIRFAYRYKYKDGEYSALSEFSNLAFTAGQFRLDYGTYDMVGMQNNSNAAEVTFNTGQEDVEGIDLCFKVSNSNVINVVEKFNKDDKGWADSTDVTVTFDNQKIYTTLTESELLRVYDNVPKKAKAQTTMGNRIMYGNYYDGYDIDTVLDYDVELKTEDIGFTVIPENESDGTYTIDTSTTITDSVLEIDLTGLEMKEGGSLNVDLGIQHDSFGGSATYTSAPENDYEETFQYIFPRDYESVADLATDQEFIDSVQSSLTFANSSNGYSLTDLFYSQIQALSGWTANGGGVTNATGDFTITYTGNTLKLQVPAIRYEDDANPGTYAFEYFNFGSTTVSLTEISNGQSLHSNRDYELGIVYLDEYNRASTALVSSNNTLYVPTENSVTKNTIRATVKHLAPSWAKRYRFVLKPSKGAYETIYSNQYYYSEEDSAWFVKLEGDNQTKAQKGDTLIVKVASNGPVSNQVKAKILDLTTEEKHFISETDEVPPTPGVYMKLKPTGYSIQEPENGDIDKGAKGKKNGSISYPTYIEDPDNEGTYIPYDIPAGSEVRIFFQNRRFGSGHRCGSRYFIFDRTFTASRDYDDMYDFIVGENIDFNNPTNNPGPESSDDTTPSADWTSSKGTSKTDFPSHIEGVTRVRYAEVGTAGTSGYRSYLLFKKAGSKCNGRNYWMDVHIQVFRAGGALVFETEPAQNTNEIYYESFKSYPVTSDRYHTGNVTNQNATTDAVIDVGMFNCFAFGNGVESFKINDALATPGFNIGARVTAVSEQDYKEAHRYADITYSGVYNEETNVNKLNEFNLGLVNFKTLEKSFGPIEKLHARQTDVLVLQEDKISYVLAGKNLLSDAAAGGAIVSNPQVLGTQISRVEEFGISNNPESFAVYGRDVYFTDSKRGAVINLKGGVGQGDQLNLISGLGMRSWFRDQFLDGTKKMNIGGYDPYSKEYVLHLSDDLIDLETDTIDCGMTLYQESSSEPITYNISLEQVVGDTDIDYNVTSGSISVVVTYDGSTVINQSNLTGSGTLTFSKDEYNVNIATITITPSNATYEVTPQCTELQSLTVVRIVRNTNVMDDKTIHHEYFWSETGHNSPVTQDNFTFDEGPVSLYKSVTGNESQGVIPAEGSTVTLRYRKLTGDTADWDSDKFKYLVSNTLYEEDDIDTLVPLLTAATPIENPNTGVYEASFTYNNPSNHQYLYLVWDYVEPQIDCTDTLSASGSAGYYEVTAELGTGTGDTTVTFNAISVPDRFQIEWDGDIVADSLFVGDGLPNSTYETEITSATSLNKYVYDGSSFSQDGTVTVNYSSSDIADSSTNRPTTGDGSVGNQVGVVSNYPDTGTPKASDGDVKLKFNKSRSNPTTVKIIAIGVNTGTAWNITGLDCPTGSSSSGSTYITPDQFYTQDWSWTDDVDPLGGAVDTVVVIEYDGTFYVWRSTLLELDSPILLSTADFDNTSLTALYTEYEQSVGAEAGSLVRVNRTNQSASAFPISDDT